MSEIDPYVKPVEFHIFDEMSFQNKENHLPSALGCVITEENYPGALEKRPFYADFLQEIICLFIQIIITVFVTIQIINKSSRKSIFSV